MPFCTQCGGAVSEHHRFCAGCGAALEHLTGPPSVAPEAAGRREASAQSQPARAVSPLPQTLSTAKPQLMHVRSGSTLLSDRDPLGVVEPTSRRLPPVIVVAVAVVAFLLSGIAGYSWLQDQTAAVPEAVAETEGVINPAADRRDAAAHRELDASAISSPAVAGGLTLVADGTRSTSNAADALGDPDQRSSVIAPGGTLAIGYSDETWFYNGSGADVNVHGPAGERASYTIFAREGSQGPWVRFDVNRRGFPDGVAGHDFGHHGIARARQIMIKNEGRADLAVDALVPRYPRASAHDEKESRGTGHVREGH